MMRSLTAAAYLGLVLAACVCRPDVSSDAGRDAGADAGLDAGVDGGLDGGLDSGTDGGDAGPDGGSACSIDADCQATLSGGVCENGACVCPPVGDGGLAAVCSGVCTDLSGTQDCGACGNVCPGSPTDAGPTLCVNGRCLVTLVRQPAVTGIALWGSTLFGTNGTALAMGGALVWNIDLGEGVFAVLATSAPGSPNPFADGPFVDGENLYWLGTGESQQGSAWYQSAPLDGGPFPLVTPYGAQSIYANATSLYGLGSGDIGRLSAVDPPDGGVLLAAGATAFAVDGDTLYWTAAGSPPNCTDGTVQAVSLSGGAPRVLASGQHQPWAIALDGQHIYWLNEGAGGCLIGVVPTPGDGALQSVPRDGGPTVSLASGLTWPGALAVAGSTVYWTENVLTPTDIQIKTLDLDGGVPTLLVDGQPSAIPQQSLLATSGALFWNDTGTEAAGYQDGRVMELLPVPAPSSPFPRPLGMPCGTNAECASNACCGGGCADLGSDLANCGGCGLGCAFGDWCNGGQCGSACAAPTPYCQACTPGAADGCSDAGGYCLPDPANPPSCADGGCLSLCGIDCATTGACPAGFACTPLSIPTTNQPGLGPCDCDPSSCTNGTACQCPAGSETGGTCGCQQATDCEMDECLDGGSCAATGTPCSANTDCVQPTCRLEYCVVGYACLPVAPNGCAPGAGPCQGG
jgi:hypothetical protein